VGYDISTLKRVKFKILTTSFSRKLSVFTGTVFKTAVMLYSNTQFSRKDVMMRHHRNKHGTTHPYPQSTHPYPPPHCLPPPPPPHTPPPPPQRKAEHTGAVFWQLIKKSSIQWFLHPHPPILSIKIYGSRNETNYIHKTNIMKTHVKMWLMVFHASSIILSPESLAGTSTLETHMSYESERIHQL